jgi:transposase
MRYALSETEWKIIQPILPIKSRGVPRVDDRRVGPAANRRSRSSTSPSTRVVRPSSVVSLRPGVGLATNARINPMLLTCRKHRDAVHGRSGRGKRCRAPAVRGHEVCRMHGAGGGAPKGNRNALKHGLYTAESIGRHRALSELIRRSRRLLEMI